MGRLHVVVEGDGADVVLLHGWGMSGRVWSSIVQRLAGRYRLTVVDLPGHGRSPVPPGSELSRWLEMLFAVTPARAVWVGWSLGGMLALAAAAADAGRVEGVATVASNLRFVATDGWPEAVSPVLFDDVVEGIVEDPVKTLQRFVALQFLGVRTEAAAALSRRLRDEIAAAPPSAGALLPGLDLLRAIDNRELASTLDLPVQMIFGGRDKLVPVAAREAISALAPRAETVLLDAAGHAPFLTHPEAFLAVLQPFLERHAG